MLNQVLGNLIEGRKSGLFAGRHFNTLERVAEFTQEICAKLEHSCDPSCGLILIGDKHWLISLRPLNAMQAVTWDMSTWMLQDEEYPCACRKPLCRKTIQNFKDLPERLRNRYLQLGIVMPEIIALYPNRAP